jgi:hypothetical protein
MVKAALSTAFVEPLATMIERLTDAKTLTNNSPANWVQNGPRLIQFVGILKVFHRLFHSPPVDKLLDYFQVEHLSPTK